jgi:hypothetical protein
MSNTLSTGLLIPIILFFVILVPEFIMYENLNIKANQIATSTVQIAERVGGFEYSHGSTDVNLGDYVEEQFKLNNLDKSKWSYEYTTGRVDYNQPMTIVIRGEYKFKIFDILGVSEWGFPTTIPIVATKSGVGQVYFR